MLKKVEKELKNQVYGQIEKLLVLYYQTMKI